MKILIIEPHPDDAILSCYTFIKTFVEDPDDSVFITNVSPNGMRDSSGFCKAIGANYTDVGTVEDINFKANRLNPRSVSAHPKPYEYQVEFYIEKFGDHIDPVSALVSAAIDRVCPDVLFVPVGLLHPMHVITRQACDRVASSRRVETLFYAECPYQFRVYGQKIIDNSGLILFEEADLLDEAKVMLKMFRTCYPTESVHWDEKGFTEHPSRLYERSNNGKAVIARSTP